MRLRLALLAAALALLGGGCGLLSQQPTVVMVSGRNDHGELERRAIGLQASPSDATVVGTVEDGMFVVVTRRDGPWAFVSTPGRATGSVEEGWIEDHYLRGEAVLLDPPPARRVTFVDLEKRGDDVYVLVRIPGGPSTEWVPATSLREIGAR